MDETDEEIWASFRRSYPRPGRLPREADHEQRVAQRVQRHRELGAQQPRRDRGLSRDEIVRAAIAIADAEGPDAISMRRIARELRAGAMSLYWHVGSKEELLDLMLESLYAEIEVPEPSGDWRADLRAFACRYRAVMLRHPWAMDFIGGRPPSGPDDALNAEQLLSILDGLDLDAQLTMNILMTVMTYVMGAVLREAQEIRGDRDREQATAGRTPEELEAEHQRFQAWFETSGRYPHILRLMKEDYDPDAAETRDERFEFGLDCVLDGVAARRQNTPRDRIT
jgi:AcrR family transcriptional regulator